MIGITLLFVLAAFGFWCASWYRGEPFLKISVLLLILVHLLALLPR